MLEAYVVVDLEMTGLQAKTERILEIGAVKIERGIRMEQFQTFVDPHRILSPRITELTGITQDMVTGAPEAVEALQEFLEFAGDLPFVGHNILFDYSFLKQCAVNHKISLEREAVDTLKIARICLPDLESRKLEALCRFYQIAEGQEHRALADAWMTAQLFERLQTEFGEVHPELFVPKPLQYRAKKQGPATPAQKRDLLALLTCHKIVSDIEIDSLTRSEASRWIDQILATYGRV